MYPMAVMCLSPLSGLCVATFPHELSPPVPNPILESQVKQSFSWLAMTPILAFEGPPLTLNPSLLQFCCKEACEPTTFFPVKWRGISRQRSMNTKIRLSCWWRWTWVVGQSSYRGRSWRRVFSSKLVALFLVSRSHSCQQHLDRSLCRSRNGNGKGRYAEIDIKGFFQFNVPYSLF